MSGASGFGWTVVVLTCQHKDSVYAFQRELELRQQRGSLPQDVLVTTVADRQEPLGSGGATLNALLVAAEHLSSRAGHTVVTADVLHDAHILILHTGRDFPWSSCSRAFCWLPQESADQSVHAPLCCLDLLLDRLGRQVCPGSPPGVWVCSTDMILHIPPDFVLSWEGFSGVRVLALPGDVSYALNHGVYLSDQQGRVRDIVYKGREEQLVPAVMPDGKVPLVSGPVFFSSLVSEKLLLTHVTPPLDGCTYLGLDSGAPPLQISLFLDVLKCLCSDVTQDRFVSEDRTGCSSPVGPQGATVRRGREELWRILRGTPLTVAYVPGGCYDYLTLSGKQHVERLSRDWTDRNVLSHIQKERGVDPGARIINSVLEEDVAVATGAVVQHCHLKGPLKVPAGCLLSGLSSAASQCLRQLDLGADIIVQGHHIQLGDLKLRVYTVMGAQDPLEASFGDRGASFLNQSWSRFCSRTGIQPEEVWLKPEQRSLLEARLFPVFSPRGGAVGPEGGVAWLLGGAGSLQAWREAWKLSLKEVMALTHQDAELQWREELLFLAGRRRVADALCNGTDVCLLPCFRAAVLGGQERALLETLDDSKLPLQRRLRLLGGGGYSSPPRFSCSRWWGAAGGGGARAGPGGPLSHLHCRRAGEHGGRKRRPQERTRRQPGLELRLPAAGEGPERGGPGPGCAEGALAQQAGSAGPSGAPLRGRQPGAAAEGRDGVAQVHLRGPGPSAAAGGVAPGGVSGQTGPGGRLERHAAHRLRARRLGDQHRGEGGREASHRGQGPAHRRAAHPAVQPLSGAGRRRPHAVRQPGGPAGLLSAPGTRSPAEGRVCVQRPGVSLLHSVSGRSADAALGGGLGAPQLVLAAHRIRTGYQQHPGGGAAGRCVQVHRSELRHGLPDPRRAPPGTGPHHRMWSGAGTVVCPPSSRMLTTWWPPRRTAPRPAWKAPSPDWGRVWTASGGRRR